MKVTFYCARCGDETVTPTTDRNGDKLCLKCATAPDGSTGANTWCPRCCKHSCDSMGKCRCGWNYGS